MLRQIRHIGLAAALVVAMVLSACGPPASMSSSSNASAVFNSGGLVLDYPSGWTRFQYDMTPSSTLLGYLATVPVGDPCTRTANSISCGDAPYQLAPGTLVVEILAVSGDSDFDLVLMPLTIGGMPASFRVEPFGTDRRRLVWEIARTSMSSFRISADLRGPGLDAMQEQVAAMVEGLELNPPVVPLPSDPDRLAEGAAAALVVALSALRPFSPEVSCFAPVPRATRRAMVVISGRPGPQEAVPVTCSSDVEASRLQMWKVVLTMQLDQPTSDLGTVVLTQWVTANGQAGNMEERQGP